MVGRREEEGWRGDGREKGREEGGRDGEEREGMERRGEEERGGMERRGEEERGGRGAGKGREGWICWIEKRMYGEVRKGEREGEGERCIRDGLRKMKRGMDE